MNELLDPSQKLSFLDEVEFTVAEVSWLVPLECMSA